MATFAPDTHDLLLHVVVLGAASDDFLSGLRLDDGVMRLGEFHGWKPRVRFVAFPADPWADEACGEALEAIVPEMDALVLTDDFSSGKHYVGRAVE